MALHGIYPWPSPVAAGLRIPSPSINGFHIGPMFIHFYALMYLVGIAVAIMMTRRRWAAVGGDPELVGDIALWSVPAGIVGGRIYFDITTPKYIPHVWYGVFAVWDGGLGIWGGIALAAVVGIWRLRKHGVSVPLFMDAVAPALLIASGIGRIGNYFNKELFGGPTSLPWGLEIPFAYRSGLAPQYQHFSTFQPTFLYELIWDFALAFALIWLGHHRDIKPPGLFALYVAGYSGYRIFEETLRIDPSEHFLGLRLNLYIASVLTLIGLWWFKRAQGGSFPHALGAFTRPPQPGSDADAITTKAAAGAVSAESAVEASGAARAAEGIATEQPDADAEPGARASAEADSGAVQDA
jgi:prolipoprotein diacylglyceryl transferase